MFLINTENAAIYLKLIRFSFSPLAHSMQNLCCFISQKLSVNKDPPRVDQQGERWIWDDFIKNPSHFILATMNQTLTRFTHQIISIFQKPSRSMWYLEWIIKMGPALQVTVNYQSNLDREILSHDRNVMVNFFVFRSDILKQNSNMPVCVC